MSDDETTAGPHGKRLAWVQAAIAETNRWIEETLAEAELERHFSGPGDWDYDYSLDQEEIARQAKETVAALERERDVIERCRRIFRGRHPPAA